MGTLDYISPEQIGGKPVDGRTDQYALACSAFELLAGAPPFRRDEPAAMMYAHLSQPPPPLASHRPDLPAAADGVFARALAKAPGDRYASCGQFADALRDALGLQPYRPGPAGKPAETRRPAETVWPETQAGWPTTEVSVPAAPDAVPAAGRLPGGGKARPRRRRIVIAACVAAACVLAAGLTAGLLGGGPAPAVTVPISVKSALPAVTGDVYVVYRGGRQAGAEVYGEVGKAADGEVAELYAQPFPYRNAPAQAGSVILHPAGGTARYEFPVTPALATRYRVELFRSSTSPAPFAMSGTATVYVILGATTGSAPPCITPVCHLSVQTTYTSPPSALPAEMSKRLYLYFGLSLAPSTSKAPATPRWVVLGAGHGRVIATQRISADQFIKTETFSFEVGSHAFTWAWTTCLEDTEAADGIGLPGHHGCGDRRVRYSASYLG